MATTVPTARAARPQAARRAHENGGPAAHARLHDLFEAQAAETPASIAVSGPEGTITYGDLDAEANRAARQLARLGVGPDARVALVCRPGIPMIVGMLGILKAGGAYVPVDPEYPAGRVRFLLQDSAVSAIVTAGDAGDALQRATAPIVAIGGTTGERAGAARESAERLPQDAGSDEHLAYIIYTSGSTGTPKGVMVEHRHVVRLFQQTAAWFQFGRHDVWPLLHSISFDFSVWEIWGALLHGGRLVIVPESVRRSPLALMALLRAERVTVLNQTPSAFRQIVSADAAPASAQTGLPDLRLIIFGGEKLDVPLLAPWMARHGDESPALVNMYGITETTVHVTYRRIRRADAAATLGSPIGVPIPDLDVHLLDDARQPVADGADGEIYVSGPGVARGYWNLPALTAERFLTVSGVRMYRSGDRARRSGGELCYLGRADAQIKVRGYRIEPGEVEAALLRHAGVAAAVVVPIDYGDGDTRLAAYVAAASGAPVTAEAAGLLVAELTRAARQDLPAHLRPSEYHVIPRIPLTAHGKVDREALRDLRGASPDGGSAAVQTRTVTEAAVLQIARDVLGRTAIRPDDDLFDIGATSLALTRILLQINSALGVALTGQELTDVASVSVLAACADAQLGGRTISPLS